MSWMERYDTKWKQHNEAMRYSDSRNLKKIKYRLSLVCRVFVHYSMIVDTSSISGGPSANGAAKHFITSSTLSFYF